MKFIKVNFTPPTVNWTRKFRQSTYWIHKRGKVIYRILTITIWVVTLMSENGRMVHVYKHTSKNYIPTTL